MDEQIAKDYLRENSKNFREIWDQHQMYETELKGFIRRPYLSAQEQFRQTELKKRKLLLKDQMQSMINDYWSQAVGN